MKNPVPHQIKKPPLLLSLVITEECNLDCSYCFVINKSQRKMSESIALSKVEKYLNSESDEYEHVQIDFTGGEPLLNFCLIEKVVNYVCSKQWNKSFSFSIGTNGTLITPGIRKWSHEHPCVVFALSFDGIKEVFDKNRSNSYDLVLSNIDFFRKWSDNKVKMTISTESIDQVANSIKHIHELGFEVAANVVFEDVWGAKKDEYLKVFDEQLSECITFYAENPELKPPYLVDMPIEALLFPRKKSERFCGSGKNMIAVDVDGIEYPCHRFLPMSSKNPQATPDLTFKEVNPKKCDDCILLTLCPSCIAYNYECNSDVDHRTTWHCEFIHLQALASAKLQYLKLKKEIQDNPPEGCDIYKGAEIKRKIEAIRILMGKTDLNV